MDNLHTPSAIPKMDIGCRVPLGESESQLYLRPEVQEFVEQMGMRVLRM